MVERSPEIEKRVIRGLSRGVPLAVLCRGEGMPSNRAVRYWQEQDAEFASAIARARDAGWDVIAHRTRRIARGKGESTGDVQRDKLIIDTDLKLLAKWDPKRYGDKTLIGSDPDNPLPAGFQVNLVKPGAPGAG